jgi:hypothetical protein
MDEDANPIALAESRLLQDSFPRDYAATQGGTPSTSGQL